MELWITRAGTPEVQVMTHEVIPRLPVDNSAKLGITVDYCVRKRRFRTIGGSASGIHLDFLRQGLHLIEHLLVQGHLLANAAFRMHHGRVVTVAERLPHLRQR